MPKLVGYLNLKRTGKKVARATKKGYQRVSKPVIKGYKAVSTPIKSTYRDAKSTGLFRGVKTYKFKRINPDVRRLAY